MDVITALNSLSATVKVLDLTTPISYLLQLLIPHCSLNICPVCSFSTGRSKAPRSEQLIVGSSLGALSRSARGRPAPSSQLQPWLASPLAPEGPPHDPNIPPPIRERTRPASPPPPLLACEAWSPTPSPSRAPAARRRAKGRRPGSGISAPAAFPWPSGKSPTRVRGGAARA